MRNNSKSLLSLKRFSMPSALKLAVVVSKYTLLYNVTFEEVSPPPTKKSQHNFIDAVDERKNELLLSFSSNPVKSNLCFVTGFCRPEKERWMRVALPIWHGELKRVSENDN